MKLSKYGIILSRLTEDDIELLRQKRNSESIRRAMNYQEIITPEMQQKWFKSIDNINNFYFIIEYKGEKIGLVNDKNVNWEAKTSEGGLFIWEKKYLDSAVPFLATVLMFEVAYGLLDWNQTLIKVRKDNKKAIAYNKMLGYELLKDDPQQEFYVMKMDKEIFFKSFEKIRKSLSHFPESDKILLVFEPHDNENGIRQHLEKIINGIPPEKLKESLVIQYL